jgi:hypothetical protein
MQVFGATLSCDAKLLAATGRPARLYSFFRL